jgi:AraC-like DNA-binding protein
MDALSRFEHPRSWGELQYRFGRSIICHLHGHRACERIACCFNVRLLMRTISAISPSCGLQRLSHFNRVFPRRTLRPRK